MLRGEIRVVNLEPVVGSEADKRRPAVIVSNDDANATAAMLGRGVVTIVPITSSTERVLPFQVTGLSRDSKAQAEQVRSVAVQRLGRVIGRLPTEFMALLDAALRLHLAL